MLKVDSYEVQPATIESASQDAFQGSTFTFKKPMLVLNFVFVKHFNYCILREVFFVK